MAFNIPGFSYDAKTKTAKFRVTLPGDADNCKRTTLRGVTRDEALAAWKKFRDAVKSHETNPLTPLPTGAALTVAAFWAARQDLLFGASKATTRRTFTSVMNAVVVPKLGHLPLTEVTRPVVSRLMSDLTKEHYSPYTINSVTGMVRRVLRLAVDCGAIDVIPIVGRWPTLQEPDVRLEMSDDERFAFMRAFDDRAGWLAYRKLAGARAEMGWERFRRSKNLFIFALECGARRDDYRLFRRADLDIKRGRVRFVAEKQGKEVLVDLSQLALAAVTEELTRPFVSPYLFLTQDGRPFSRDQFYEHFHAAKGIAGIERRMRPHDLRHTFGTRLADAGVDVQDIQAVMGHASVTTTMRYINTRRERAAQRAAAALDGTSNETVSRQSSPQRTA